MFPDRGIHNLPGHLLMERHITKSTTFWYTADGIQIEKVSRPKDDRYLVAAEATERLEVKK
jgi:hypothetical protein